MASRLWLPGAFRSHVFTQPRMLVEPVIPWGGMFVIHGPRASGKTQVALALAALAANGGGLLLGAWDVRPAKVVFIEADTPEPILQSRLLPEHDAITFLTSDSSFDVLAVSASISSAPAFVEARRTQPELVIVDSLRKSHRLDENDSNTPNLVYGAWRSLFPGATLGFVHHDRKGSVGALGGDPDEAFRGSSAWLDDVDTGIHVVRDKKVLGEHRALLSFSKVRTCEQPEALALRLDPTTLRPEPTDANPRLMLTAHLEEAPEDREPAKARRWLEARGVPKTTAWRTCKELGLA